MWLEDERANLHAAVGYAAAAGQSLHAMLIPAAMAGFLEARGYWDQGLALHQAALAAARQAGDLARPGPRADAAGHMQLMRRTRRPPPLALPQARRCTATSATGPARPMPSTTWASCTAGQPLSLGRRLPQQALELYRDLGHRRGQADALTGLGTVYSLPGTTGPPPPASGSPGAVPRYRPPARPGPAFIELGAVQQLTGDYPAAVATLEHALALCRDLGDRYEQA